MKNKLIIGFASLSLIFGVFEFSKVSNDIINGDFNEKSTQELQDKYEIFKKADIKFKNYQKEKQKTDNLIKSNDNSESNIDQSVSYLKNKYLNNYKDNYNLFYEKNSKILSNKYLRKEFDMNHLPKKIN